MLRSLEGAGARRTSLLAMLLALAVSLVALINPSPASAAAADVHRYVTNVGTGLQLSANFGNGTSGDVYTVAPSTSIYHDWYIADGNSIFINNGTGQCLSSNYGNGTAGDVYTVACSGVSYQNWRRVVGTVPNYYQIINAGTGWCLSSNFAGDVYTVECSGAIYHNWNFS
jgi:hypothetical protein